MPLPPRCDRSHDTSGVNAPPKHQPLTMAMVGLGKNISRRHCQAIEARCTRITPIGVALSTSRKYSLMSMPAENDSPAPVSTSTWQRSSTSSASSTLEHFAVERRAHGVALFRPVERHPGDAVLELDLDVLPARRGPPLGAVPAWSLFVPGLCWGRIIGHNENCEQGLSCRVAGCHCGRTSPGLPGRHRNERNSSFGHPRSGGDHP